MTIHFVLCCAMYCSVSDHVRLNGRACLVVQQTWVVELGDSKFLL